jgi:hypothetical protein
LARAAQPLSEPPPAIGQPPQMIHHWHGVTPGQLADALRGIDEDESP